MEANLRENDELHHHPNVIVNEHSSIEHTENSTKVERIAPWESMSFACGGWLQFYMFGVGKAIQAKGLDKGVVYLGCSAGSLAALGLALQGDFDKAVSFCKDECIPQAYTGFSGLFKLDKYVAHCLDYHCGLDNWIDLKPGALQIAITRLPFLSAERATTFASKEDLRSSILASCAAFPCAAIVHRRGAYCLDGGLSDFQPTLNEKTITVSPFYFSDCDIKPSRYVPFWWAAIPPKSADTIDWLYNLGWEDAMHFIESREIPNSPDARPYLNPVLRKEHHYDVRKRVSMHRFLGYDIKEFTHHYIGFLLDFMLLIFFVLLWKPLSIFTIYMELYMHCHLALLYMVLSEIWAVIPFAILAAIFLSPIFPLLVVSSVALYITKVLVFGFSKSALLNAKFLSDCMVCILSLSLFLRFFSILPSNVKLRKHSRLQKVSLLYRIFHHIM